MNRAPRVDVNLPKLSLFRGRLLRAAGLTLITAPTFFACTNEIVVYDGSGGAGGSDAATGSTSGNTSGNTTSGQTSGVGGSMSAVTVSTTSGQGGAMTTSTVGAGGAGGGMTQITCFTPQGPCPTVDNAINVFGSCTSEEFLYIETWIDGPFDNEQGECCYEVVATDFCGVGRPYSSAEGALVASSAPRADWSRASQEASLEGLTESERKALASAWLRDALFEHASVASFSRFALELMAVGAPPDLVADAHRAALDEIEHARLCFALASRFAGAPAGPGAFPMDQDGSLRTDLVAIAAATAAEGCIGETLAASLAQAQRDAATDPAVRAALDVIAADEARHAELAWRTVAWALRTGGAEVRVAVAKVFADARSHTIPSASQLAVASHGLLSPREQAMLQMHVLTEVIAPCAAALLASVA